MFMKKLAILGAAASLSFSASVMADVDAALPDY